jgi:uncharacterized membrane protein (DUF4010 family)
VLPTGGVDQWRLIEPRTAWVTVILIATLGFANYVLLKLYGARGLEITGFLGGLVNSTVTVTELANRAAASGGRLSQVAFGGVVLATGAMLIRNLLILGMLAPRTLLDSAVPLTLMLGGTATVIFIRSGGGFASRSVDGQVHRAGNPGSEPGVPAMQSPFSLTAALKFGLIFLALQVAGTLALRAVGHGGFYAVSVVGGVISSASATAAAANLAAAGTLPARVAGTGAILASVTSAIVNLPIVARLARDRALTRRLAWVLTGVALLGAIGVAAQDHVSGFLPWMR